VNGCYKENEKIDRNEIESTEYEYFDNEAEEGDCYKKNLKDKNIVFNPRLWENDLIKEHNINSNFNKYNDFKMNLKEKTNGPQAHNFVF